MPVAHLQPTSRPAILYILRELGRRAGATPDWIANWRVEFHDGCVALYPQAGSGARLYFPFDPSKVTRFAQLRDAAPCRYLWMDDPPMALKQAIPDFVVPFQDGASDGMPLFVSLGSDAIECRADILAAALWTMSRLEESIPGRSDAHGRIPATESVACRFGFLDRPIVDEYAMAFRQALSHLLPGWTPLPSVFRLKLSHDIDLVGFPRSLRSSVGHIYPRRIPPAFFRDALSSMSIGAPAYLQAVLKTAQISREGGFDSAFYWKASARTAWDSGYDPRHPQVRRVIDRLGEQGFEHGVHPAYGTFGDLAELEAEVGRLRCVVGRGPIGGRQHFLRWRPSSWSLWEKAGLAYDSSVGFADAIGFRAGTAIPYHPWFLDENRESTILEIPLIVMDCTPVEYMRLGTSSTLAAIASLVRRCDAVGGVFTLLWHNSSVIERPYTSLYSKILSSFPSRARYDWTADLSSWPLPKLTGSTAASNHTV